MKLLSKVTMLLAIILLSACKENVKAKEIVETEVIELKQIPFQVIAVHDIEVKSDIDLVEFETFVKNEIAPIYQNMKGQYFSLVKGDRGMRTNNYSVILTFDSLEDRDRIYPPSGELVGDFGPDETWEKFAAMLDKQLGESHTDYIKVFE